jgi:hypothetical protein
LTAAKSAGPASGANVPDEARRNPVASRAAGWNAVLLAAFLVGVALRAWQLDIQVLIDDEWHAIHKLLHATPLDILTHLGYADYSIPLTLYYQWLYRTSGLSEWGMHLPPLLAGIALLAIGPRLLARWFPLPARAIWLALVAISPLLVYHSKVARPYALSSLLTFVAIIAFRAWWLGGHRRDAAVYVAATFLGGWLHLITLPFTLLPFVHYGVRALRRVDRTRVVRLANLGIATALPLAVALVPPIATDWSDFALKTGRDGVTPESLYRTALMLAGTGASLAGLFVWSAAALGFMQLLRRDADLAWYLATVIGVGAIVVASSGAEWISHPLVLARYLMPALPFVLLLAAEGIAAMLEPLRRPLFEAATSGIVAAALFFAGPIDREWHYPNQFWGHLRYQFDYDPAHNPYVQRVPADRVPAFYAELARRPPGSVTLIEAPWRLESHFNAYSLYQDVHRQLIRIGLVTPVCGTYDFGEYPEAASGMRMRQLVHVAALLRGDTHGADYLVMHVKPRSMAADPGPAWPDVAGCLPGIEARLGAPVYRDEQIVVFPLTRLSPLGNNRGTMQQ